VDVLEHARTPLTRVLPPEIVRDLLMPHTPDGVRVRCATRVDEVVGTDRVTGVRLHDGTVLDADLVLMAIGASPDTDWLRDSSILVDDGVVCDGFGATSAAGVWAAGDVARWPNSATGQHLRSEQWQAAKDQAHVVARSVVEGAALGPTVGVAPLVAMPYFWSDFFGLKVQLVGHCAPSMRTRIVRAGRKSLALMGHETVQAVLGVNSPRGVALSRPLLGTADLDTAHTWAQGQLAAPVPATPG
jgi:NADPH-dependent 2,4-dienoyl-CoA reductase/sulfur reductase-like enzyme